MKYLLIAMNIVFGGLLLAAFLMVILAYNQGIDNKLSLVGGTLTVLGVLFNWYYFNRLIKQQNRKQ